MRPSLQKFPPEVPGAYTGCRQTYCSNTEMSEGIQSILPSIAILGSVAAVALFLTLARGVVGGNGTQLRAAVRVAIVTVLLQGAHFAEELATGFHLRFPELFGLPPMPAGFFVWFNLGWLAIWSLSIWGLAAHRRIALFPLWFLALAAVVNLAAHPLLALRTGGYFPGLFSSPFVGIAGAVLLRQLLRVTDYPRSPPPIEDDPIWQMAGVDDHEPEPIDDVVYR